jgi:hypothetical protein
VVLHSLGDCRPVAITEEPIIGLGVPHEGVAVDGDVLGGTPFYQGVGPLESPGALAGMNRARLHAVFRRQDVEVLGRERQFLVGIVAGQISRHADEEVILVGILDGRALLIRRRRRVRCAGGLRYGLRRLDRRDRQKDDAQAGA